MFVKFLRISMAKNFFRSFRAIGIQIMKGNIIMDVRNNTPAYGSTTTFGMALLKPSKVYKNGAIISDVEAALKHFERNIYGNRKPKLMDRAVRQLKGNVADNAHYDIDYIGDSNDPNKYWVQVIDKATKNVVREYDNNYVYPNRIQKFFDKLNKKAKEINEKNYSKVKEFFYAAGYFFKGLKEIIPIKLFKPAEYLPAALRAAADEAAVLDKQALRQEANVRKVNQIFNEG